MDTTPFNPAFNGTTAVATVAGLAVSAAPVAAGRGYNQIRVANESTGTVWIAFAENQANATTTNASPNAGYPVLAGMVETISVQGKVYAAVFASGANGSVWFTPGSGL